MANVNCYPTNNVVKPEQPVNSQFIQKILDENVGLIHAIIEKQQQNQEAEDLLKNLHKNLIYLATIADQTTSAGNQPNATPAPQIPYTNYPQATATHPIISSQNFPSNIPQQSLPYVTQPSTQVPQAAPIESVERKLQSSGGEEAYKESNIKPESNTPVNVDMDREPDKCHNIRESSQQIIPPHKNVDIDKECLVSQNPEISKELTVPQSAPSAEFAPKFDENISTASSHMQNPNVKTDMPPPSQPIGGGIHQDKSPMQYPGSQRIMYPGVTPNYNQYNPHFDQNSKFYPQNMYQQSPYNYQGMYNPYQQVAPPVAPTHYNQHMMNTPMYPQYPYYQQPPAIDQMPPGAKDAQQPQQMHPANPMSQPMPQPMYPGQNSMPPSMHPPSNTMSQSTKPQCSESAPQMTNPGLMQE